MECNSTKNNERCQTHKTAVVLDHTLLHPPQTLKSKEKQEQNFQLWHNYDDKDDGGDGGGSGDRFRTHFSPDIQH